MVTHSDTFAALHLSYTFKSFFYLVFADLNLKILKEDDSCPGASQVINWIKACFDALDKKYVCIFFKLKMFPT